MFIKFQLNITKITYPLLRINFRAANCLGVRAGGVVKPV